MPTNKTKIGEMLNRRTKNSKTWMNFDGSYTSEIHMRDIHFEDKNNNLHNINTDLFDEADLDSFDLPVNKHGVTKFEEARQRAKEAKAKNKLNRDNFDYQGLQVPFESILPRNWKRGYTIGKGQDRLTFIPVSASPAKGYVNNQKNVIEFQDAWNDADVTLELTDIGIKETIVLKTDRAPSSFRFEVKGDIQNLTELKLQDAWLKDNEGTERDVTQNIVEENGKTYIELVADVSNLAYPIEIDPTVTIQPDETAGKDAYINALDPSLNGSGSILPAGNDRYESLIQFDLSSIPNTSKVTNAVFSAYAYSSSGTSDYGIYKIDETWDETNVTWDTKPAFFTNEFSLINKGSTTDVWDDYEITTLIDGMVSGTYANNGWYIRQPILNTSRRYYNSSAETDSTLRPKLVATYNEPPSAPTVTAPNGGETWNAEHTITWNASTDPDSTSIQYHIQLSTDNGATWKDIVALTTANVTSYTYDFSGEPETSTALIRIRAYDGNSYSAWDESDGVFTIQHNQAPTQPTNLSPSGGEPRDRAQIIRFEWQHNDPDGTDPQSKFDLDWRYVGNTTWNTITEVTPNNYYDMPANTFNHGDVEWRVRTYDQEGLSSPYSETVVFLAGDKPSSPTITSSNTVTNANPTIEWSSSGQTSYTLNVKDSAGTIVYTHNGGTNKAHTIQYDLANNSDYTIELTITNSDGLTSDVVTQVLSVSYSEPTIPLISTSKEQAGITLLIDNGDWKVEVSSPTFTGTGDGGMTGPTATDGTTDSHSWKAVCVATATDGGTFDVYVDGVVVGQATVGTTFTYEGLSFTINDGATDYALDDQFTWNTTAIKVMYNNLYRRVQGGEWVRIATNISNDGDYTDYTVASGKTYEYYARAWGDNDTYSDSGTISDSITLSGVWLHDVTDVSTLYNFKADGSGRDHDWSNDSTNIKFAGRELPVTYMSEHENSVVTVNLKMFREWGDYDTLNTIIKAGNIVCYRDGRGRQLFGTIVELPFSDTVFGYETQIRVTATSYEEAV